jgi:hypothetical protein
MSVLETPRILFRGNIAWDPIVTNNYQPLYDENLAQTQLGAGNTVQEQVQNFRKEAIADVMTGINSPRGPSGNWNPHGTHRSTFYDLLPGPDTSCPSSKVLASEVSGVDLGSGLDTSDSFCGAPARFTGMLVDLEPYGSQSSQLFFDTFTLGIDGGCRIAAKRRTRFTARYINFFRNPEFSTAGCASVIWQTSFLTEDLTIDAFDSEALRSLQTALEEPGVLGLTVRFSAYRTVYYDCPDIAKDGTKPKDQKLGPKKAQELIDKLNEGGFQPNPARSKFVGVVGLWREGEPLHEPGDRALLMQVPARPTLGTAYARLGTAGITLDFGNSTGETGLDLTKKDWGPLELQSLDANGEATTLATLTCEDHYSQVHYEAGSGLVSLPLTEEQVQAASSGTLQIVAGTDVMLLEDPVRAVPVVPNIYADQGDSVEIQFQVYERGMPAGAGTALSVFPVDFNGNIIGDSYQIAADDSGVATLNIDAAQGEVIGYVPAVGADVGSVSLQPMLTPYVYVRTLATNAWMDSLQPTWDNVYGTVLANWNAMAPCMDNWLRLDRPDQVYDFGPMLKKLTDPANIESFRYMPVTRDMTQGERKLLYAFLDGPKPQAAAAPAGEGLVKGMSAGLESTAVSAGLASQNMPAQIWTME